MTASYPSAVHPAFSTKNDAGSTIIHAADVSGLEDEIIAIETTLGTNAQGASASVSARIAVVEGIVSGTAWSTYTPTWKAVPNSPVNQTLGNGVLIGRYKQIGKTVFNHVYLKWGSTTSSSGTDWCFLLPVTPINSSMDVGNIYGTGSGFSSGSFVNFQLQAIILDQAAGAANNVVCTRYLNVIGSVVNGGGALSASQPSSVWGNGSFLTFDIVYEAA